MKRTKKYAGIIGASLGGCVLAYILWKAFTPISLCRNLSCISFPDSASYREKERYTDTDVSYRALYTSGNRYVRISLQKYPSPADAAHGLQASIIRMKALFEKAPAPYPGDVSDSIVCDPAHTPTLQTVKTPHGTIEYFTGYLNGRMTFGSCSEEESKYKGILAYTACQTPSLTLQIEFIAPVDEFTQHQSGYTKLIRGLSCTR